MLESNTTQQLGRTEEVTRDVAWEQAFLAQLTDELADSVAAFAKKRASWLNGKRKRKDDFLWKELYQDAITDTWTGDVTWDPHKAPLDLHLKRVIRSRTSMTMKHLTRFPRVSAYCATLGLELEMSESMAADRASERGVDLHGYVDDVIAALYQLATGDETVTKILDCFGQGLLERRDIVRATGMPASTYDSARRRLLALAENLPQDLRDEAIRAMA
jgi:hypothetical protein